MGKINMRDDDFEDALQIAVAIRNSCETFLTLDKNSTIPTKACLNLKYSL
ncbi:hypothetical protein H6801_02885 [Candidatus Nomurabacteria bacterium]|nr:hypothetical protein [Candidatus Nomurabacteria bacterium]